jgi:hypothetical protein
MVFSCERVSLSVGTVTTGIGGFNARLRSTRNKEKDEEAGAEAVSAAVTPASTGSASTNTVEGGSVPEDKPRRKAQRRRPKNRLVESYPSYLQVCRWSL